MKKTETFTVIIPYNNGRELLGTYTVWGIAECRTPADIDSYRWDVEDIIYTDRDGQEERVTRHCNALMSRGEADHLSDAIEAHVVKLWGVYLPDVPDHTTDSRQDFPSLLEVFGGMFNPNQMRA